MLEHVLTPSIVVQDTRFGGHDVSSAQAVRIQNINNCVVFGKHYEESVVIARLLGPSAAPAGPAARNQGKQNW